MARGSLRRFVEISWRPGEARGIVEDDFHHFRTAVQHRDGRVTAVRGTAVRHPWTLCPLAAGQLDMLVGMPLERRLAAVLRYTDQLQQCTHMFDLAGLCIAAAAREQARRTYEIAVPDRIDGETVATLKRDGAAMLTWNIEGNRITGPEPYSGQELAAGFTRWTGTLPEQEAEAALVLRRGVFISKGRARDLDLDIHSVSKGGCFVQQPQRAASALRMIGSTHDFSERFEELGADDGPWLNFVSQG